MPQDPVSPTRVMTDEEYRQLEAQHHQYESRLGELAEKVVLSDDEQVEESTLKKKKLQLKDRMQEIARRRPGERRLTPEPGRPRAFRPGRRCPGRREAFGTRAPLPAGSLDPAEPLHHREPVPGLLVHRADPGRPLRRGRAAHRRRGDPRHAGRPHRAPDEHAERVRGRVRQPRGRGVLRRRAGAARLQLGTAIGAARGLAGRVPVPGLRRAAPRALQRAAPRRRRPLLRGPADPGGSGAGRGHRVRAARAAHASAGKRSRCWRSWWCSAS